MYFNGVSKSISMVCVIAAVPDENIVLDEERDVSERINYNERFHWNAMGWPQGRLGFGPFGEDPLDLSPNFKLNPIPSSL